MVSFDSLPIPTQIAKPLSFIYSLCASKLYSLFLAGCLTVPIIILLVELVLDPKHSMGFPKKPPVVDGGLDLDGSKRWVIAGIPLRAPLKPISTNPVKKEINDGDGGGGDDEDEQNNCATTSTTPTSEEARIPSRLVCPPAPRKRKATFKCNYSGGVREFFTPPDLETLFVQRAN